MNSENGDSPVNTGTRTGWNHLILWLLNNPMRPIYLATKMCENSHAKIYHLQKWMLQHCVFACGLFVACVYLYSVCAHATRIVFPKVKKTTTWQCSSTWELMCLQFECEHKIARILNHLNTVFLLAINVDYKFKHFLDFSEEMKTVKKGYSLDGTACNEYIDDIKYSVEWRY